MVNFLTIYMHFLHCLMKLVGVRPKTVDIEPGTILHFWVPTDETTSQAKNKPNKPVVVFVHGFGFNGILTWQFQVLSLARKYAVYVPDLLFFGGSITDKTERSLAFQAECMAKGLRKLGVEKCTLVGLSYGGIVGFKMAELYPDLVESMVITGSVVALTESITLASTERLGVSSWAEFFIPVTVMGVKELLDTCTYKLPWIPNFVYKHILEKERTELLEAMVVSDKDFTIPCYTQRIHLLWGEKDKIFNMEIARKLEKQLQGKATLHYIEKARHIVQVERPFAYNRHLKKNSCLLV